MWLWLLSAVTSSCQCQQDVKMRVLWSLLLGALATCACASALYVGDGNVELFSVLGASW